ncbi:hypothetical protein H6P81_006540 [Aristolochia fimbriata]|uniref:CDT1 Geminin-binding domain-containing protein n=1 Tax=Aristolochia fimbriata TaxID=158543 RepID=A0AAV7EYT6_ARIFI|nr:hypothetical protein H6P81_006540 [Aristolochia fimbriata]
MDQESPSESKREALGYKHELIPLPTEEPSLKQLENEIDGQQKIEDNQFGSPTPPPVVQPPRIKQKGAVLPFRTVKQIPEFFQNVDLATDSKAQSPMKINEVAEVNELPDNYKILAEFFDRLDTSLRLLRLRQKLATFRSISIQVEILTKRKFLYSHLAQIKYIYPEAIKIEKVLKHDETTLFMKPDLKVTLLPDAVNAQPGESMALCRAFRSRLIDFLESHQEDADIPEALLPEPFNQSNASVEAEILPSETYKEVPQPFSESESILNPSLLSPSFQKIFSEKHMVPKTDKAISPPSDVSSIKFTTENLSMERICSPTRSSDYSVCSTTPSKHVLTPLAETPMQKTPKRLVPSPYDSCHVSNDTSSHSATKRSLKFSLSEAERDLSPTVAETTDKQVGKDREEVNEVYSLDPDDKDEWQLKSTCLTDLFNTVYVIFQNINYSSVTKQELVHKILWQNCDIIETRVVEEQLELLEEFIPEWLCKKIAFGGHILYSLKRTLDPDFIRAKLGQAVSV